MAQQVVMKHVIEQKLKPIMIRLFQRIKEDGLTLEMDGVPAYNPKAQFVAGKVINQSCFTALEFVRTEESIGVLGDIIRMMSTMEMETWGMSCPSKPSRASATMLPTSRTGWEP